MCQVQHRMPEKTEQDSERETMETWLAMGAISSIVRAQEEGVILAWGLPRKAYRNFLSGIGSPFLPGIQERSGGK